MWPLRFTWYTAALMGPPQLKHRPSSMCSRDTLYVTTSATSTGDRSGLTSAVSRTNLRHDAEGQDAQRREPNI